MRDRKYGQVFKIMRPEGTAYGMLSLLWMVELCGKIVAIHCFYKHDYEKSAIQPFKAVQLDVYSNDRSQIASRDAMCLALHALSYEASCSGKYLPIYTNQIRCE